MSKTVLFRPDRMDKVIKTRWGSISKFCKDNSYAYEYYCKNRREKTISFEKLERLCGKDILNVSLAFILGDPVYRYFDVWYPGDLLPEDIPPFGSDEEIVRLYASTQNAWNYLSSEIGRGIIGNEYQIDKQLFDDYDLLFAFTFAREAKKLISEIRDHADDNEYMVELGKRTLHT